MKKNFIFKAATGIGLFCFSLGSFGQIVQTDRHLIGPIDSTYAEPDSTIQYGSSYGPIITYTPPTFSGNTTDLNSATKNVLKTIFKEFKLITLDITSLNSFVKQNNYFSQFNLNIDGNSHLIEIQPNDLRAENFKSTAKYLVGSKTFERDPLEEINNYKGFADGLTENIVRFTIKSDEITGYVYIQNLNQWLFIEPVKNVLQTVNRTLASSVGNNVYVVYQIENLLNTDGITCGAEVLNKTAKLTVTQTSSDPCTPLTLEVATEADYEYYSTYGSNTVSRIFSILNLVEGVYMANFNMQISITYSHYFATSSQPYNTSDGNTYLQQIKNYWDANLSSIQRDVVMDYTGKALSDPSAGPLNGIAMGIGEICYDPSKSYLITRDRNGEYVTNAHELGHLFNALHSDGSCVSGDADRSSIMCTGPDKTLWFSQNEFNKISSWINTYRTCLENPNSNNTTGDWIHMWTNHRNLARMGTWNFHNGDRVYTGDFDGNGSEEFLCINYDASWASIEQFQCGHGNDFYHMWSNMGSSSIATWRMNVGDRYYVGDFNGDGKTDLLSISASKNWATIHSYNNGTFQFAWSNMGNRKIGTWYVNSSDNFIVGDYDGDGKDELLCFSNNGNGYSSMINWDSNWSISPYGWSNLGSGKIGGVNCRSTNAYRKGDYHLTGQDELFTVDGTWATFLRYDWQSNSWLWIWSNYGSNNINGWGLPLGYSDYVLSGNIDTDSQDELMFLQNGQYAGWSTTMDFTPGTNNLNWNWSNYGNGHIGNDWNQSSGCNYFLCKALPQFPQQVLAIKTISRTTGWWIFSSTTYTYQADLYRHNNSKGNLRIGHVDNHPIEHKTPQPVADSQFLIYPNPNSGSFNLKASLKTDTDYSIYIYDILGKEVFSKERLKEPIINIDLTKLPKGIYQAKILNENKIVNQKIILQ